MLEEKDKSKDKFKNDIIDISKEFQVLSKHTAIFGMAHKLVKN